MAIYGRQSVKEFWIIVTLDHAISWWFRVIYNHTRLYGNCISIEYAGRCFCRLIAPIFSVGAWERTSLFWRNHWWPWYIFSFVHKKFIWDIPVIIEKIQHHYTIYIYLILSLRSFDSQPSHTGTCFADDFIRITKPGAPACMSRHRLCKVLGRCGLHMFFILWSC
jgi:hypothetical protein